MESQVSQAEVNRAKILHSVVLFDLIVIHVFVFVLALSLLNNTYIPIMAMPIISLTLLGFVLYKAGQSRHDPSHFVRCHILLAAKRARLFLALFLATFTFSGLMYFGSGILGISKLASIALAGGVGQLPFMVVLLVLVVLEFDAEHQCKTGKIPASAQALDNAQKKD